MSGTRPGETTTMPRNSDASLPELVGTLGNDISELLSAQVDLAKQEVRDEVQHATKAVGAMAGAAVVGLVALVTLAHAAAWGIAEGLPTWLSFLIVGIVLAVVAGVMVMTGRSQLERATPVAPRTQATLKGESTT